VEAGNCRCSSNITARNDAWILCGYASRHSALGVTERSNVSRVQMVVVGARGIFQRCSDSTLITRITAPIRLYVTWRVFRVGAAMMNCFGIPGHCFGIPGYSREQGRSAFGLGSGGCRSRYQFVYGVYGCRIALHQMTNRAVN